MGVPSLFRWLSRKYPKIISPVIEEDPVVVGGIEQPIDYSAPNPNGELDNLYLDMNGIVHPCSHPENKPPPESEDEMMLAVFEYTDRVLNMARPRKLLMIAVDGVAPRAKMNQQRSRRFRSARDAKISNEERERKMEEMEKRGEVIDEGIRHKKTWDSNAITPGTPFMDILAESLRFWVAFKLANDPGWSKLQVIISDSSVPGEGEHKIMNFIRSQRSDPEYNPNTTHCIYGLDADLIFLSLATHEPHFRVLREDVYARDQFQRKLRNMDQFGIDQQTRNQIELIDKRKPFIWLHIGILREYLAVELSIPRLSFKFDFERAIDDWVFMCFFCGNDFLPHLPCLDVRDSSIDTLVSIWKRIMPRLKGYITCDGQLDLAGVESLLGELGRMEDTILYKKHEKDRRREDNFKRRKIEKEQRSLIKNELLKTVSKGKDNAPIMPSQNMTLTSLSTGKVSGGLNMSNNEIIQNINTISKANSANQSVADVLRQNIANSNSSQKSEPNDTLTKNDNSSEPIDASSTDDSKKRSTDSAFSTDTEESTSEALVDNNDDVIRMWEPGFRKRYYQAKFHTQDEEQIERIRKNMVKGYVEGISWVLLYYYQGCPSWNWYYPFHYAPFALDFKNLTDIDVTFERGEPFKPFEQLMSVLPADSKHNLPDVFGPLMCDENSEIIDFYPEEFQVDMNGAKMAWQGISLLPFIDEKRLLKAVRSKYDSLTPEEVERNTLKHEILFLGRDNAHFKWFKTLYSSDNSENLDGERPTLQFHGREAGLAGTVLPSKEFDPNGKREFPLKATGGLNTEQYVDVPNSAYMEVSYRMPPKAKGKSMLLNGYISHLLILTEQDKDIVRHSHNRFPRGNHFEVPTNIDYSQYVGPHGKTEYTLHVGGYKSYLDMYRYNSGRYQQTQQFNRYSNTQQNLNFNQGNQNSIRNYDSRTYGGYNNSYNNGYNNNYNNGYNNNYSNTNGFNNNYHDGGYNQRGYNNGYSQPGNGHQQYDHGYNQGYSRGRYNQRRGYGGNGRGGGRGGYSENRSRNDYANQGGSYQNRRDQNGNHNNNRFNDRY